MLAELLVGVVILGLVAASIIWGLNQLNAYATASRLYTAAQTLAQNQIDLLLTRGPFNPQLSPPAYPTPNILQSNSNGTPYTYYTDPSTGSISTAPISPPVPIYTDPTSNLAVVSGTIATTNQNAAFAVGGTNLTVIKSTVTVSYTFRNKTYNVSMDTMRTSDL
jgi:type II secretory pathway pseudopilin PulG